MKKLWTLIKIFVVIAIVVMGFYFIPTRYLNVESKNQFPNMPNGCEITSLSMLMKYSGYDVSKEYLNDNFLKKSGFYNTDPEEYYIGNPYKKSGYYSYAKPIADCANRYFENLGVSQRAEDKTGMSVFGVLNNVIFDKKPVAVWYTIDDKSPEYGDRYYTNLQGEKLPLYKNLHCVVVEGVGKGKVYIIDPIQGKRSVNFVQFIKLYYQMGQRAVII
ncbi:C39 family peptidase [Peptostreptococcus faecalis]|uniref:C39 family peptidase n=1 Tax=Peptostreptococcus faecalis TaxID=2045015 RepID=UPI000C7DBCC9|nr:C39 family peptidase [Peptostreptococcus faecalis]